MRGRGIFGAMIALLLMMVVVMLMTTGLLVAGIAARVETSTGTIQVQRGGHGDFLPLAETTGRVKTGDVVKTGADSRLVLSWADGSRMEIGPDSQLEVRKYQFDSDSLKQVSMFRLDAGRVWARVAHKLGEDSRFEVETPSTVAGVRGTIFSVEVAGDASVITVYEGAVEVRGHDGQPRQVPAGQLARVSASGSQVRQLDALELDAAAETAVVGPGVVINRFLPGLAGDGWYPLVGKADAGAKVTIDGDPVNCEPDGSFTHRVPLVAGRNEFEVVVADAAGHQRTVLHAIEYKP